MKKWFVVKSDGETSGGFFNTEENARKHLELARQVFPDIAREFRVASGQVTLDDDEKKDE